MEKVIKFRKESGVRFRKPKNISEIFKDIENQVYIDVFGKPKYEPPHSVVTKSYRELLLGGKTPMEKLQEKNI